MVNRPSASATKPNMGIRKKPLVLPRAHINLEPSIQILNSQAPPRDHIDLESFGFSTHSELLSYLEASVSTMKALSKDFHFHSSDKFATRSPQITDQLHTMLLALYNSDNCNKPTTKRVAVYKDRFLSMSIQIISAQSKLLQDLQILSSNDSGSRQIPLHINLNDLGE